MPGKQFVAWILVLVLVLPGIGPTTVVAGDVPPTGAAPLQEATPDQVEAGDRAAGPVRAGETAPLSPPADPSAAWWRAVQEGLRSSEYHVSWQEGTGLPDLPVAYQASNRAHNLRFYFTPEGIRVAPRTCGEEDGASPPWQWALGLERYLYGQQQATLAPAELVTATRRVEYRRDNLREWYLNDVRGLRQGFTLPAPIAESATAPWARHGEATATLALTTSRELPREGPWWRPAGQQDLLRYRTRRALGPDRVPVQLTFHLSTTLVPSLYDAGQGIDFATAAGQHVLSYGDLQATDAAGRHLPVYFVLSPDQVAISLTLEGVRYPVSISATLSGVPLSPLGLPGGPTWTATGDQAGANLGYAVSTAGDVDGDGFSDLLVGLPGYDGEAPGAGRVLLYYGSPTGPTDSPGWTVEGTQDGEGLGRSVAIAGDVDGDGYSDVLVGAPGHDLTATGVLTDAGRAYLYLGSAAGLGSTPAWTVSGDQVGAALGGSLAPAGDVDGDGYGDVLIGVPAYDVTATGVLTDAGRVDLYLGSAAGLGPAADWTASGDQAGAHLGSAVGTAGDVDGDGYADVLVGAPQYDISATEVLTDAGRVYLYAGSAAGPGITATWTAAGDQAGAHLGTTVDTAGDVDGDGYADVLVGAPHYDISATEVLTDAGQVDLYAGSAAGPGITATWSVSGDQAGAHLGQGLAPAGDVDGDGYADVLVGAPDYDHGKVDEGRAYLYAGSAAGLEAAVAWTAESNQAGAHFGQALAPAGDVDGDGYSDVLVGAPDYDGAQADAGQAYLYRGAADTPGQSADWSAEGDQAGAQFGYSVATAGDVDGDGYADVVVGAPFYDNGQADEGLALVYYGSPAGLSLSPGWVAEGDQAGAQFGHSVATAGDVDGDGYADLVVGAPFYDNGQVDEGRALVYYGSPAGLSPTPGWTAEADQAGAQFGYSVGTAGDVDGDGYADLVVGAPAYDNGQTDEGRAYLYRGTAGGMQTAASWTAESDQAGARYGQAVAAAGDVNGDGYADLIVGVPRHDGSSYADHGRALVYHGALGGLPDTHDWRAELNGLEGAQLGTSVGTAGDVNGDGYADVVVGRLEIYGESRVYGWYGSAGGLGPRGSQNNDDWTARGQAVVTAGDVNGDGYADVIVGDPLDDLGQTDEGRAHLHLGSPNGLGGNVWQVEGNQAGAQLGRAVGTAGDVDGDGYADLVVAAPLYDNGQGDEGQAYLYHGNGGPGPALRPRQRRADGSAPIAPQGMVAGTEFQLQLIGRAPTGRTPVRLQWQVAPVTAPFTATAGVISGTSPLWTDPLTTGVVITQHVAGLLPGMPYHWRARLRYPPGNRLGQVAGRWVHVPWNGWLEKDLRTADGPISGFELSNDSPTALGDLVHLTATSDLLYVTYTWDLGDGTVAGGPSVAHLYPEVGVYTVLATASNPVDLVTATTTVTVYATCWARINDDPAEYHTVQAAVDASTAPTDLVKVAGTCVILGSADQVAYLSKTLTLRGGYTLTNWTTPDPAANPTVLDARGQGRVLYIVGAISPTVEGLRLTGGDATGLGGGPWGNGAGGGVYLLTATATLSGNYIYDNGTTYGVGGGVYLDHSPAQIEGNTISSNTTDHAEGCGLFLDHSPARLEGNTISNNTDCYEGGGLYLNYSPARIEGNTISNNTSSYLGGGLYLYGSDATLISNTISGNAALGSDSGGGGGAFLEESPATLRGNIISDNYAGGGGGGLILIESDATLVDNRISDNVTDGHAGGLIAGESEALIRGNVVSGNVAGIAGGMYIVHASTATIEGNLISGNVANWDGGGVVVGEIDALFRGNVISGNVAGDCGGVISGWDQQATWIANLIVGNVVDDPEWGKFGGGWCLEGNDILISNVIVDNQALGSGGGIYMGWGGAPRLLHNTFAGNSSGDGSAIHVTTWDGHDPATIFLTNTILVSHSVGITASAGNTAHLDGVLWFSNGANSGGAGTITVTQAITGNPLFAPDGYHLLTGSAAIDAGVPSGVDSDIDGQIRPMDWGYDLGADEYPGVGLDIAKAVHWPQPVPPNPGQAFTYTIAITGVGSGDNTGVVLTDTLPPVQRALAVAASAGSCTIEGTWGGTVVCPLGDIPLGLRVAITITVEFSTSAVPGQRVVNHAAIRSGETANETRVSTYAQDCHVRINDDPTVYHYVQAAVDAAAPGDTVKIAGTCLDTLERAGLRQQVYLTKSLALCGGYRADFAAWDPLAYPTTLEAQGLGRVLYVLGAISPTIEALQITGGDGSGQSSTIFGGTSGGGLYVLSATATISGCQIAGNYTPERGGGIFVRSSPSTVAGNTLSANRAGDRGGGLYVILSPAEITGNTIVENSAYQRGGGLYLNQSPAAVRANRVVDNWIWGSSYARGGGLYLARSDALLANNVVTDNRANDHGSGLYIARSSPRLLHTTIARNGGGDGSGLYVNDYGGTFSTVRMTNTILVSQSIGIWVTANNTATLEATLWGDGAWANGRDWAGGGTVLTGTANLWGDPAFQAPDAGDYHISRPSAALNTGVDAGVAVDIDGEPRPVGPGYDLGADELLADLFVAKWASADPVPAGAPLTYTLRLTNSGYVTLNAAISDVLPAQVVPSGTLTWTAQLAPGAVWTETVVVTVALGYGGPLTNAVQATTAEGATGAYTLVVTVEEAIDGLEAFNDGPTRLGDPTTLTATVTAGTNVSYSWDLGDGPLGVGAVVSHTYPAVGVYTAVVTASNQVSLMTATTAVTVYRTCWARLNDDPADYWTVQAAVDASTAPTDVVKVAGTCDQVNGYGGLAQVVYLSKTLTVQGGYTVTDWTTPDPAANPTVLDARGQGRVLYIVGAISPTVEGLWLTGGDATGLDGGPGGDEAGGGVYVLTATATLSGNHIFDNRTDYDVGGGVYLGHSPARLEGNTIISNTTEHAGSGLYLYYSPAWLEGNTITNNTDCYEGGGLYLYYSPARLEGNTISSNTVGYQGGGLYLYGSDAVLISNTISGNDAALGGDFGGGGGAFLKESPATLTGNTVLGNHAEDGGGGLALDDSDAVLLDNVIVANIAEIGAGLYVRGSAATFEGNLISDNLANFDAGGLFVGSSDALFRGNVISGNVAVACGGIDSGWGQQQAVWVANIIAGNVAESSEWGFGGGVCLMGNDILINNVIVDNQAVNSGSGLYVGWGGASQLLHNTFAGNSGGDGSAIHVTRWDGYDPATIFLTNTILVSHTVGITVSAGNTARLDGVLWFGNGTNSGGAGTITVTQAITGNPLFAPDGYHLLAGSAAIDAGVPSGVDSDIDGQPRPIGWLYDLGADEFPAGLQVLKTASAELVLTGEQLTYSLRLTNSGIITLNAAISDVLPAQVIPSGTLTWTAQLAPGGVWTETVAVTVALGYAGPLTNAVQATTQEGAIGAYTLVVTVEEAIAGLEAFNDSPTALGEPTTLTATVAAGDPVSYSWSLGDGTAGVGPVVSHTYPAVGAYTALVTASNRVSLLTATTVVTVEEAIAGLEAFNDSPTAWGDPTTLTATVTAGDPVSYSWSLGDGTAGVGPVVSHTYPAVGVYTAVVTASNQVSLLTATTVVIVEEPIAGLVAANDSPTLLGEPTTLTATVTAGDPVSYGWDLGDGTVGVGPVVSHTYPAVGTYTAVVTASNQVSLLTATTVVTVGQPLLDLAKAASDRRPVEGDLVTYTIAVSNGGSVDATGAAISDTLPPTLALAGPIVLDPPGAGLVGTPPRLAYSLTITAGQSIELRFPVRVLDGTAAGLPLLNRAAVSCSEVVTPAWGSVLITATNQAPALSDLGTNAPIDENDLLTLTGAITDPGRLDTFSLQVAWGDGFSQTMAYPTGTTAFTLSHRYLDDPGSAPADAYTLSLLLSDDDAGTATGTITATVHNVPPIVEAGPNQVVGEGQAVTFSGRFTDPGSLDSHTIRWDLGDGTEISDTLTPTHLYAGDGVYTVTLEVADDDGGVGHDTTQVTVTNLAPQAVDDSYSTSEDATLVITAPGVLANDSDPGGDPLFALPLAPPTSGTLALQPDGAFTYTPEPDWSGRITFRYAASDGELTGTATVTVTVGAVNDPPVADAGPDQRVWIGHPAGLDGSASYDPDGHLPLSYRWTQTAGLPVLLSSAAISQPTFTAPLTPTVLGFDLVVTDAAGLPDPTPDAVVITVSDEPIAGLFAHNDSPTVWGDPTTLTATIAAGTNVTFAWDLGDGRWGVGPVLTHTYSAVGTYTAVVTASNSVSAMTATTTVTVTEPIVPVYEIYLPLIVRGW